MSLTKFASFHQAALEGNESINHPALRLVTNPRFPHNSIFLHSAPTGKAGFVCVTSDERVCKEKDLEMIGDLEWAENLMGAKVPNGTISIIIATNQFKMPAKEFKDLEAGFLIPDNWTTKPGTRSVGFVTDRVSAYFYNIGEFSLISGVVADLAAEDEEDSLAEEKHRKAIEDALKEGNARNEEVIKQMHLKMPPAPVQTSLVAPPPNYQPISFHQLPKHSLNPVTFNFQFPANSPFPHDRICYSTFCLYTFSHQYAVMNQHNYIEFYHYDRLATPQWKFTDCCQCLIVLQRSVRNLGFMNPFVRGEHPGVLTAPPSSLNVESHYFPSNAPFAQEQILCQFQHNYFILRPDGCIGTYNHDTTKRTWSQQLPKYVYDGLTNNVRQRGINNPLLEAVITSEINYFVHPRTPAVPMVQHTQVQSQALQPFAQAQAMAQEKVLAAAHQPANVQAQAAAQAPVEARVEAETQTESLSPAGETQPELSNETPAVPAKTLSQASAPANHQPEVFTQSQVETFREKHFRVLKEAAIRAQKRLEQNAEEAFKKFQDQNPGEVARLEDMAENALTEEPLENDKNALEQQKEDIAREFNKRMSKFLTQQARPSDQVFCKIGDIVPDHHLWKQEHQKRSEEQVDHEDKEDDDEEEDEEEYEDEENSYDDEDEEESGEDSKDENEVTSDSESLSDSKISIEEQDHLSQKPRTAENSVTSVKRSSYVESDDDEVPVLIPGTVSFADNTSEMIRQMNEFAQRQATSAEHSASPLVSSLLRMTAAPVPGTPLADNFERMTARSASQQQLPTNSQRGRSWTDFVQELDSRLMQIGSSSQYKGLGQSSRDVDKNAGKNSESKERSSRK